MNRRIQLMYLSMCIVVMARRINGNRTRMDQLLNGGEVLSSARLVKLDMANQKLGCRMHGILKSVLTLRAAVNKSEQFKLVFLSNRRLCSRWTFVWRVIEKRSKIIWSILKKFGCKRRLADQDSEQSQGEKYFA